MLSAHFYAHFAGAPIFNMGFDEWLLEEALGRPGYVAIRLYSWLPGGITFGFNQREETALAWDKVAGTPVIRRVTGGRALYHDPSEFTYAIAVNQEGLGEHPLGRGLRESSAAIAEALVHFLDLEGMAARYQRSSSPNNSRPDFFHKAPCFASSSKYEVTRADRKLVASAQKRLGCCLLQHGSIKLSGVAPHPALIGVEGESAEILSAMTHEQFEQGVERFRGAMERSLGVTCVAEGDGAAQNMLRDRAVERVKKNPLARREIIAHAGGANGL